MFFFFFFEVNSNSDIALTEAKLSLHMHKAYVKICQYLGASLSLGGRAGHQTLVHQLPDGAAQSALRWAHGRAWSVTAWCSKRLLIHGAYSLLSQLLSHYS